MYLFIYLFNYRDNAIHPQGICGLRKTKEKASNRPSAGLLKPSALGSAQVSGCEPPLQKNDERKVEHKRHAKQITLAPRG
jgi:hypothetical protein